jgi:hypothetical protein
MPSGRSSHKPTCHLKLRAEGSDQNGWEVLCPVAGNFVRSLLGFDSRRAFRFLQFGAQIRLPFYLLLITVAFVALFAWHAYSAYAELYTMVMTNVPESFQEQLLRQTQDFSIVGGAILGGLALTLLGFSIAYTHTLLGPIVALRRQVQSMKDGNYRARNKLRKTDVSHQGLADDLNELASILQHAQSNEQPTQGTQRSA